MIQWAELGEEAHGRARETTHPHLPLGLCVGGHSGGQTTHKLNPFPALEHLLAV